MLGKRDLRRRGDRVTEVIGLCGTMVVRHCVVLVGPTGGDGKALRRALAEVTSGLASSPLAVGSAFYRPVRACAYNPRAVTMRELYSEVSGLSLEWRDGLLLSIVSACCSAEFKDPNWSVRDSPVGAFWIENLDSVLGDDEFFCPADSKRV